MANKKYTGILKRTLTCGYGTKLLEGQRVIVYKRREYDENSTWTGKWEYHYHDENGKGLIRSPEFLI